MTRRTLRSSGSVDVAVIAGAGGVLAALSGAEPTGTLAADLVLTAGFCTTVALAASRSRRWWWLTLAAPAAAVASPWPWRWFGVAALAAAFASSFDRERRRVVGALVAAGAMQSLVRLEPVGGFGVPSLITAAAVVPVLVSGYRHARASTRRTARRIALGLAGYLLLAVAGLAVAGLDARTDAEAGIDAARAGLDAARDGDEDAATASLTTARTSFASAADDLGGWLAAPARLVPVLAQHADALTTAAAEGRDVTAAALDATLDADVDELRASNGRLDLDAIAAMTGPLARSSAQLDRTLGQLDEIDSPWLLAPLARRLDDLRLEIIDARPDVALASTATTIVPRMLGADRPQHYLVLFPASAESRELGGVVGNFTELTATDGQVSVTRSGRSTDLYSLNPDGSVDQSAGAGYDLADLPSYPPRYLAMNPGRYPQNLLATPDLATVARASADYYEQRFDVDIDGLIVIDAAGLASLLDLTGPVEVAGWPEPVGAANAVDVLQREQYLAFTDEAARTEFLAAASDAAFDALLSIELPSPRRLGDILGPAVHARHLQVYAFDPDARDFLATVGLLPDLPAVEVDSLASVTSAAEPHKLDAYLQRSIDYAVTLDPATGAARATLTVRLDNTAPPGLPDYVVGTSLPPGANRTRLSIYTPLPALSSTVDGRPAGSVPSEEYGRRRHQVPLTVAPGTTTTVTWELDGGLDLSAGYVLDLVALPRARADTVTVTVTVASGWTATQTAGPPTGEAFELVDDTRFTFTLTREDPP